MKRIAVGALIAVQATMVIGLVRQSQELKRLRGSVSSLESEASPRPEGGASAGAAPVPSPPPLPAPPGPTAAAPSREGIDPARLSQLIAIEVDRRLKEQEWRPVKESVEVLGRALHISSNDAAGLRQIMQEGREGKEALLMKLRTGEVLRADVITELSAVDTAAQDRLKALLGEEGSENLMEFLRQHPEMAAREYLGFSGHADTRRPTSLSAL